MSEQSVKGESVELYINPQARQRVVCGLRWDPALGKRKLGEVINAQMGKNTSTYDLDLMCLMYNEAGEFVDGVTGKPDETIDESGNVYHSGDDTSGAGDHDDEQVSVEFKGLPDYIRSIFFVAEIQSAHTFGQVNAPEIRIADGLSDKDQLLIPLNGPEGKNRTACIFARLHKRDDTWFLQHIGKFMDVADVADWTEELKKYL